MQHTQLASGRWKTLTFVEQMANVGSEVERTLSWRKKGRDALSHKALERALELIELTQNAQLKHFPRLKEISRLKECLIDDIYGENQYGSSDQAWSHYFRAFTVAARAQHNQNL